MKTDNSIHKAERDMTKDKAEGDLLDINTSIKLSNLVGNQQLMVCVWLKTKLLDLDINIKLRVT